MKYFPGAQIAHLCCSSDLPHALPSTVWQTAQKSHKIRCVVPDNDLPNLIYMKTISIWLLLWQSKAESNLFVNTCIHPHLWWLATSNLASAMFWHSLQKFRPSQWYGSTGNIKYTVCLSRATLFMHDTEWCLTGAMKGRKVQWASVCMIWPC